MRQLRAHAMQVARFDFPVLLLGESGTGKEVLAHLIHKYSDRAHRTFLKVNCAAVPSELLESELFGYEPGAFTGANKAKPGKFELCNKGTLLLDEIGEMSPALQAKLLQVLQDGQFSRLGGRNTVKVDVRVLAATNINMPQAIAQKTFREDLYYRLNSFVLRMPSLRERREEIPMMLRHFMIHLADRYACAPLSVSQRLVEACENYPWPGNIRELENFVKRYLVLGDEVSRHRRTAKGNLPRRWRSRRNRCLHGGETDPAAARPERDGPQSEEWRGDGSDRAGAGRDRLEPQARRHQTQHQLQSAALQNPPIRHPSATGRITEGRRQFQLPVAGDSVVIRRCSFSYRVILNGAFAPFANAESQNLNSGGRTGHLKLFLKRSPPLIVILNGAFASFANAESKDLYSATRLAEFWPFLASCLSPDSSV